MGKDGSGVIEERDCVVSVWRGEMGGYDWMREEDGSAVRDPAEKRRCRCGEGIDYPHAQACGGEKELQSGGERCWVGRMRDL